MPGVPAECRVEFRVCTKLGDIIVEDRDIFGDAARKRRVFAKSRSSDRLR